MNLRTLRLRGVWLLVIPFLLLARPTPALLLLGAALALLGVALRAWAAGYIHKERALSTHGPYAHTRNPLYLGSFLIGVGVSVAAGRVALLILFGVFYLTVYGRVIRGEARLLEERFGAVYVRYAEAVPLFFPRIARYRADGTGEPEPRFTVDRWRRNREYEALLGVAVGFLFLTAKLLLR